MVDERSGGQVVIEPVWTAAGFVEDWDQLVARMVVSGELDMGMIPSRAWDTEGVTSLRALQAPFLVDSNELVAEVLSSELEERMLAGLDAVGVTGLALLPEGLRHPFGFGEPMLSPADYQGQGIRAPSSEVSYALFDALGAVPDDVLGNDFNQAVRDGSLRGAESGLALSASLLGPAIATGNVTFFPKVNSLVINADAMADLTGGQRTVLRDAAVATQTWVLDNVVSEAEVAQEYCRAGYGDVVLASDADIAALERAAEPVYELLDSDDQTRAMIEQIRALEAAVTAPATAVAACESSPSAPVDGTPAGDQAVLDGVYRLEITPEDLRGYGVTNAEDIAINIGVWTWTLRGGQYEVAQRAPGPNWDEQGRYEVSEGEVTFYLSWVTDLPLTFTWKRDGTTLVFELVGTTDPILDATFSAHPWTRIG